VNLAIGGDATGYSCVAAFEAIKTTRFLNQVLSNLPQGVLANLLSVSGYARKNKTPKLLQFKYMYMIYSKQ